MLSIALISVISTRIACIVMAFATSAIATKHDSLPTFARFNTTPIRFTLGTSSRNFPMRYSQSVSLCIALPVTFPPGRRRLDANPPFTGSPPYSVMTIGIVVVALVAACGGRIAHRDDDVDVLANEGGNALGQLACIARFVDEVDVAPFYVSEVAQALPQVRHHGLRVT